MAKKKGAISVMKPNKLNKNKPTKPQSISQYIKDFTPTEKDIKIRKSIKLSINNHLKKNSIGGIIVYANWYCGITKQEIITRINQHENARKFIAYFPFNKNAENVANAHDIERYFHEKGTINDKILGNATIDSTYVYIFKESPTIIDVISDLFSNKK